jgi:hypothetical protein
MPQLQLQLQLLPWNFAGENKEIQDKSYTKINPFMPNGGRTAPLTSRRCILNIYSTNIHTEYFKHAA